MPATRPTSWRFELRVPRNTWKIVAIAFAAGLLCFLLAWLKMRADSPAITPQATAGNTAASPLDPLPAPLPAGGDGAADMPQAQAPQAAAEPPPASAPATPPAPTAAPAANPTSANDAETGADQDLPQPLPDQSPAPRYPPAALRRGDSGTVVVRVDVAADGTPAALTLTRRSGSRELDRAAMEAARNWRFQPARRNGQPVAGSVDIPFDFKPE